MGHKPQSPFWTSEYSFTVKLFRPPLGTTRSFAQPCDSNHSFATPTREPSYPLPPALCDCDHTRRLPCQGLLSLYGEIPAESFGRNALQQPALVQRNSNR